jgi:hypothetical protein
MPIYEQTYRRYEARAALRTVRFWPSRAKPCASSWPAARSWGLLLVAWGQFLFRVIQIYVVTRLPEAGPRACPSTGGCSASSWPSRPVHACSSRSSAGRASSPTTCARARSSSTSSRPLTRRDYVLGKLGVLLALNLSVTLVPGLLLYLIALALAPDQFAKWSLAWIGPAVVLHSLVTSLVMSLIALAVSSSRAARAWPASASSASSSGWRSCAACSRALYDRPESALLSCRPTCIRWGTRSSGSPTAPSSSPGPIPRSSSPRSRSACLAILRARVRAVEIVR